MPKTKKRKTRPKATAYTLGYSKEAAEEVK